MSFEPDNFDADIDQITLLSAILLELKRLNIMVSEMSELRVRDEDIQ